MKKAPDLNRWGDLMKLKPCPFCGGNPRFVERTCDEAKYGVGCSNEFCIIYLPETARKRELHNFVWMYVEKECMVKAWNKRHHNKR